MNWLLSVARERLGVSRISIALPDISGEGPPDQLQVGLMGRAERELAWFEMPSQGTYCAQVMKEARCMAVTSVQQESLPQCCHLMWTDGMISYLGAPVPAVTGGAIGTLAALQLGARIWSRQDRVDLEQFANWVGLKLAPGELGFQNETRRRL